MREVSTGKPFAVVSAEVGCNHNGDLRTAKRMIRAAREAGAYIVKFQKRHPELREDWKTKPYSSPHSYGTTYLEHRQALEFTAEQHADLWNYCRSEGIIYTTSVWDIPSFNDVKNLSSAFIKIPSACNEDWDLLQSVSDGWKAEVHISNGMASPGVEDRWRELFGDRLTVYVATSSYPCRFEDVNLADIPALRERGFRVGLSGHHLGIALDIAAVTLGAEVVERHFTLDRTQKGNDHAASLEPDGLRKLVRDIEAVGKAWNRRQGVLPSELETMEKLKVCYGEARAHP